MICNVWLNRISGVAPLTQKEFFSCLVIASSVLLVNIIIKLSPTGTTKKFEGIIDEKRDTSEDFFVRLFKSSNTD